MPTTIINTPNKTEFYALKYGISGLTKKEILDAAIINHSPVSEMKQLYRNKNHAFFT